MCINTVSVRHLKDYIALHLGSHAKGDICSCIRCKVADEITGPGKFHALTKRSERYTVYRVLPGISNQYFYNLFLAFLKGIGFVSER